MYALIEAAQTQQYKALIALCGLCGCRVAEALAIRPCDFDLTEMILTIRGKGEKERKVPISTSAWSALQWSVAQAYVTGGGEVVGLKDRFARRLITTLGKQAGLMRPIASHDLRMTFGTCVYDKTLDIRLTQELLGHGSVSTTEGYTGIAQDKMRGAVEL